MPNFRTYSVFLVSNFLSLSTGKWEFCVSIFVILYVCIYFVLDWYPWFGARLWVTVAFFFFAGTIDFLFFLLVYAWCFVNCQSNLQNYVKTENGSIQLILIKMLRYCYKKLCACIFFIQHTLSPKNLIYLFLIARFNLYMYPSCSLDCSIYHWKLVIHQSIKVNILSKRI